MSYQIIMDSYQIGATIGVRTEPHPLDMGLLKKYDRQRTGWDE